MVMTTFISTIIYLIVYIWQKDEEELNEALLTQDNEVIKKA
jgi:hypothetical protein